ncbi:MAG: serine/threonine-protein kinase [Planctomycetota bacterium]
MTTPREIDRLCDEFEATWKNGSAPKLADFLHRVEAAARDMLLVELIGIDLEYRFRTSALPKSNVYAEFGTHAVETAEKLLKEFDAKNQKRSCSDNAVAGADSAQGASAADGVNEAGSPGAVSQARFRILRPHAKGGLGQVSVALDCELNREVALKELQENLAEDEQSRLRFNQEAEITGSLEHPGIVPVYGLGRFADGRPYYAMRFIRGDSLKEAIEDFHRGSDGTQPHDRKSKASSSQDRRASVKKAPDYGSVAFRKLLGRFIDVCHAVSYAHSRGVLHRDLKPGNIMLGRYGETLVIDWGLARAEGDVEPSIEENSLPAVRVRTDSNPTMVGSAVGTPAYMSPEQAAGQLGDLGTATDIYSLGATLSTLLTGRSPIAGTKVNDILEKVKQGDIIRPRACEPSIPKPLEMICLKAMAPSPADRYSSVRALSEDIERWLADEPVSAWHEDLLTRVIRWLRRHRGFLVSSAVLLIFVSVFATASAVVINQFRLREQAMRHVVEQVAAESELAETRTRVAQLNQLTASSPELLQKQKHQQKQEINRLEELLSESLENKTIAWLHMRKGELLQNPAWNDQADLEFACREFAKAAGCFREELRQHPTSANTESLLAALDSLAETMNLLGRTDDMRPIVQEALGILDDHIRRHPDKTEAELWLTRFSLHDERLSMVSAFDGDKLASSDDPGPDHDDSIDQLRNLPWPTDNGGKRLRIAAIRSRFEALLMTSNTAVDSISRSSLDAALELLERVIADEDFSQQAILIDWIHVSASLSETTSSLDAIRSLIAAQRSMMEKGKFDALSTQQVEKILDALARTIDSLVRVELQDTAIQHQQWAVQLSEQLVNRMPSDTKALLLQFDQGIRLAHLLEESGRTELLKSRESQLLELGESLDQNAQFTEPRRKELQRIRDRSVATEAKRDPFKLK